MQVQETGTHVFLPPQIPDNHFVRSILHVKEIESDDRVSKYVLPNGLRLLYRRDSSADAVAIVTRVGAGYLDESDNEVGISHVLEHMFFKGTPSRSAGEMARETRKFGGWLNAHTIYDHTSYVTVLPSRQFSNGLDMQFDAWANAVVNEDELRRELEVIVQEASRKRDTPQAVTVESLFELLHDRHKIRRWRIGEPESLRSFTRNSILAFRDKWYIPSNTIVSVVGNVDEDVVVKEVTETFGTIADECVLVKEPVVIEEGYAGSRFRDLTGDVSASHYGIAWRVPTIDHVDAPVLDVAGILLSSGRASRLHRALIDEKLASNVSAWYYSTTGAGVFLVYAESTPEKLSSVSNTISSVLESVRDVEVSESELIRVRQIIQARHLRRYETMDGQANYLASWEARGGVAAAEEYLDRQLKASANDVRKCLKKYLDPGESSVLVLRNEKAPSLEPRIYEPITISRASRSDQSGEVSVFHTSSGLPVLLRKRASARVVDFGVFCVAGAAFDPAVSLGISRLMARSVLKGTSNRSGYDLSLATESLGSSISVATGVESLSWSMSVPQPFWTDAMRLLAEAVQYPLFADEGVESERQLALAELGRMRDDMYRWPMSLCNSAAFAGHPYSRTAIGNSESLLSISSDAVRDWHRYVLEHSSPVLAITGNIVEEQAAEMVDSMFPLLRSSIKPGITPFNWPSVVRLEQEERARRQTGLALLFEGAGRQDTRRYTARVLAAIAGGMGGRFFEELRSKQSLAYTVSVWPLERMSSGAMGSYIATEPKREQEARQGLIKEFQKFALELVSDEELSMAQSYLTGSRAISLQSGSAILSEMVDAFQFGTGLQEILDYDARIAAVSKYDIQDFAQTYFVPDSRAEGIVRGK